MEPFGKYYSLHPPGKLVTIRLQLVTERCVNDEEMVRIRAPMRGPAAGPQRPGGRFRAGGRGSPGKQRLRPGPQQHHLCLPSDRGAGAPPHRHSGLGERAGHRPGQHPLPHRPPRLHLHSGQRPGHLPPGRGASGGRLHAGPRPGAGLRPGRAGGLGRRHRHGLYHLRRRRLCRLRQQQPLLALPHHLCGKPGGIPAGQDRRRQRGAQPGGKRGISRQHLRCDLRRPLGRPV